MSKIALINKDDGDNVDLSLGEMDDECHRIRQELEALRNNRTKLRTSRLSDIKRMEHQYQNAKEKLQRKLPEHANIATYRQFLRYYQQDTCKGQEENTGNRMSYSIPSSNYIIQRETPLLSAMHRSFCVLPHQMELFESEYEREIYPYFRKEIQDLHLDSLNMTDSWMSRLSNQAEENDALYNSYRTELESIEMEVKRYRRLLLQQTAEKNLGKESEKGCDESTVLSETDHSTDSDSSRGEVGGGFLKDALFLFTSSPTKDTSTPSPIDSISDAFHDHLCKGGAALQNVANNFFLPFASTGD